MRLPLLLSGLLAGLALGILAPTGAAVAQEPPIRVSAETLTMEISTARGRLADGRRQAAAAVAIRAAEVVHLRARVVAVARQQIGDRYSAGSAGPHAFDCSGLTRYVYKVATGKDLPHQSHAQYARVVKISRKQAQPGDLVFFFRNGAHHVGIYIGRGRMIDAPNYGKPVRISPISGSWWSRSYTGMGRVLPA